MITEFVDINSKQTLAEGDFGHGYVPASGDDVVLVGRRYRVMDRTWIYLIDPSVVVEGIDLERCTIHVVPRSVGSYD